MVATAPRDLSGHPAAPDVPMSLRARLRAVRTFHTGIVEIAAAGGPVTTVRLGPRRFVPPFAVVTSPQGAHDVLAGSDGTFDKEMIVHVQTRWLGTNVFDLPHEPWKARRRALQPAFTKKRVSEYAGHMAQVADERATALIGQGLVDLDEEMRRLTLHVVGRSVFGLDLGEHSHDLGPHVRRALQWVTNRSLRPVRSPAWLPTPARWRLHRSLAAIRAVVDQAIDSALSDPDKDAQLVRLLLDATDPETGRPLDREAIRDELIVFLLAGHDTTATTLAYALWALGRRPELQDRVAAEAAALGDRPLTVEDVALLPYTVQVLHETLRICPPAPAIGRLAMTDAVVDGYLVPAGTNVVVGAYALHHDPALWAEPSRFDPDRFSADRMKSVDRWQYLPFGAGPRSCIADHFAMLEATLGLATMVRAARFDSVEPEFPLALPFTMTAAGPIPARVRARVATHATAVSG
ncbi:cytochrome P450 [Marmoricola sp. URHA0025 HA25]